MATLQPGQRTSLLYSPQKRHRVLAGLSWDARTDDVTFVGKLQGDTQHDLDICAYIYDDEGDFIDLVTADANEAIDESGCIYHSGDDQSGEGEGDDEAISVELLNLPDEIHDIFFLIEVQSNHFLGDIAEISMRIADGLTDNELLYIEVDDPKAKEAIAFTFAHIYRSEESGTGWMLHYIGECPDTDSVDNWGDYFKQYLS
ncbi:MAG: TerD family protein [Pseudomonadota bacterium]